ncbi:DMT family transporter, partial [Collinsella aerofaciens]
MNNGLITYLAALLLFGSNGIIAAAIALPSSDIVLLRTFLGAFSLVTILAITQRHKLQAPSRPREAAALILSGAALGASWIFLFRAYQTIGVGVSSLLYYCGPIIVMALSPFIFGEKLTGGKIAGFIAVACGAFLIAAQGLGGNMPIAGIVCGIASAFCYALMVIASKGAPRIEGLENSALQLSAAFVTALVLTLVTQGTPSFFSPGIATSIDWRAVAMLGVVNTGIGCL